MRYFITKDAGSVIRDKQVYGGDDTKADAFVASYLLGHPGYTAQEVDQTVFDSTVQIVDPAPLRTQAVALINSDSSPNAKLSRAILLVILDEINVIRALLPSPPGARTNTQLKTAVQTKLNSGAAD